MDLLGDTFTLGDGVTVFSSSGLTGTLGATSAFGQGTDGASVVGTNGPGSFPDDQ